MCASKDRGGPLANTESLDGVSSLFCLQGNDRRKIVPLAVRSRVAQDGARSELSTEGLATYMTNDEFGEMFLYTYADRAVQDT